MRDNNNMAMAARQNATIATIETLPHLEGLPITKREINNDAADAAHPMSIMFNNSITTSFFFNV